MALLLLVTACLSRRRTLALFVRDRHTRRVLWLWALLVAWCFLHLALVRHYGGAWWGGDWLEHAQRAAFFMGEFPGERPYDPAVRFVGEYGLAARPPLQNLVVAFLGKLLDRRFEWLSLVSLALSTTAFLSCALFLPLLRRRGRQGVGVLVGLLALSPFFLENVTLPWTKLLAAFYVLAATWFYVRWLSKRDVVRLGLAALLFAAGILVHYSAIPFAIVAGAHFLVSLGWRGPGAFRQTLVSASLAALLLATWFGYALAEWGAGSTFLTNTAVTDSTGRGASGNALKIARNVYCTTVPYFLRAAPLEDIAQPRLAGFVRDAAFIAYQTNLLLMPGLVGGPLVLWLLARSRRHVPWWPLGAAVLLAIASHGGLELFGVGHVVLQPVALLAMAFLAAGLPTLPRAARVLAVLGAGFDYALGGLLHFHLQNVTFRVGPDGAGGVRLLDDGGLVIFAAANWWQKASLGISFWGDRLAPAAPALEASLALAAVLILARLARDVR